MANIDNYKEITTKNRREGRPEAYRAAPAYKCDVTPLPLLDISPPQPQVYAPLWADPTAPAPRPPTPATRQAIVCIDDGYGGHIDYFQHTTAHGISALRGLDCIQISLHHDHDSVMTRRLLNRLKANLPQGIIAGIYANIPTLTWCTVAHEADELRFAS